MELTKHPRFRFMPGMLTTTGPRVLAVFTNDDGSQFVRFAYSSPGGYGAGSDIRTCSAEQFQREHGDLDLSDAATVGCLNQLYADEAGFPPRNDGERMAQALMDFWNIKGGGRR